MRGTSKIASVKRSTPSMAAALPEMPMPETVMVRLVRILASSMTDYFEPVFRGIGQSENAFHVLCLLVAAEDGQASPSELSELVGTSRANMTRILEQLVQDGLVTRAVGTQDARRHIIRITSKGRRIAKAAVPKVSEPLLRAFSDLSAEEFSTLDRLLRKTVISLDKDAKTSLENQ